MYITAVLIFVLVGFAVTIWLPFRLHIVERAALSFLLGVGSVTAIMFWISAVGLSFRLPVLLPVLFTSCGLSFFLAWRGGKIRLEFSGMDARTTLAGWTPILILLAVLGLTAYPVIERVSELPVVFGPDAISRQGPAIAFANEGTVRVDSYALIQIAHPEYPLLVSLAMVFGWMFDPDPATLFTTNFAGLFPLFYAAMVIIFYFRLRQRVKMVGLALVGALVLSQIPFIAWISAQFSLNLPAAVYMVVGCLYLYTWWEENLPTCALWLPALLFGFSAWTRLEGVFLGAIPLAVACLLILQRAENLRERLAWPLFVPYLILACQWAVFRRWQWGSYGRLVIVTNSDLILIGLNIGIVALYLAAVFLSLRFTWANWFTRRIDLIVAASILLVGGVTLLFILQDRADTMQRLRYLFNNLTLPDWGFIWLTLVLLPFLFRRAVKHWYLMLIPLWMLLVWVVIYAWDVTGTWPNPIRFSGPLGSANRMLLNVYPLILFAVVRLFSLSNREERESMQTPADLVESHKKLQEPVKEQIAL